MASKTQYRHPRFNVVYLAVCGALATPTMAGAQDSGVSQLAPVQVQGVAPAFKPEAPQSVKFQAPLVDTPQTINIVPSEVLQQQNAQTLQEVLSNVPGVTFSSGEGGAGWGDMMTIRGFSAEQSVTVDGVRESALSTRTDIFNMEQAEVFKGTGSIESGVGAVGGSVNLVTKTPKLDEFYDFHVGVGTDHYRRTTADINQQIGDNMAFRLNAMWHENDVAKRGGTDFERWGIAPSFTWGLGTDTRVTAMYMYQKDDNTPDWGVPVNRSGQRMDGVSREYWGQLRNVDTEQTEYSSATLRVEHDFNDKASIRNQTRWSQTKRFTLLNTGGRLLNARGASGAGEYIPAPSSSDYWGYDGAGNEVYPTGYLAVNRIRGHANSYKGRVLANQTDLNLDFNTGSVRHQLVTGVEFYEESYRKDPRHYSAPAFMDPSIPAGAREALVIDVRDPNTHYNGPWSNIYYPYEGGAKVKNWGLYAYDQITLNERWELAAGIRYDKFKVNWYDDFGNRESFEQSDGVWSGRLGVVYKPSHNSSVYLSYSQASQPSAADAASRSGGGDADGQVATYSPGKAKTWELGTKWDVLENKLALTAAVFQVERSNPSDTDELGQPTQISGKERVRGIELGAAGSITPKLSVYGGWTLLRSKVLTDAADPLQEGGKMKNVPDMTFNLWSNYQFNEQWDAGLGAQYIGKRRFAAGNYTTAGAPGGRHSNDVDMPSYWLFNAAVGYKFNQNFALRLNVNNIFDKFYLQRSTSSSDGFQLYAVPGAGRTIMLSADARF